MLQDFLVEDESEETRTHKIFNAIDKSSIGKKSKLPYA